MDKIENAYVILAAIPIERTRKELMDDVKVYV
jgi:hypothetical protein